MVYGWIAVESAKVCGWIAVESAMVCGWIAVDSAMVWPRPNRRKLRPRAAALGKSPSIWGPKSTSPLAHADAPQLHGRTPPLSSPLAAATTPAPTESGSTAPTSAATLFLSRSPPPPPLPSPIPPSSAAAQLRGSLKPSGPTFDRSQITPRSPPARRAGPQLHGNLKPSNCLLASVPPGAAGGPTVRLTGFEPPPLPRMDVTCAET